MGKNTVAKLRRRIIALDKQLESMIAAEINGEPNRSITKVIRIRTLVEARLSHLRKKDHESNEGLSVPAAGASQHILAQLGERAEQSHEDTTALAAGAPHNKHEELADSCEGFEEASNSSYLTTESPTHGTGGQEVIDEDSLRRVLGEDPAMYPQDVEEIVEAFMSEEGLATEYSSGEDDDDASPTASDIEFINDSDDESDELLLEDGEDKDEEDDEEEDEDEEKSAAEYEYDEEEEVRAELDELLNASPSFHDRMKTT
ncbi:hypothetical protein GQ53DRAFT_836078 [Thozetella sp. PMI_491]|nr:hypothetical protein GQ53DRAFT_836078 [Thozetella sp. PMI_491]